MLGAAYAQSKGTNLCRQDFASCEQGKMITAAFPSPSQVPSPNTELPFLCSCQMVVLLPVVEGTGIACMGG